MQKNKRREDDGDNLHLNNLPTLNFGLVQANTGIAISENVSKNVTTGELGAF